MCGFVCVCGICGRCDFVGGGRWVWVNNVYGVCVCVCVCVCVYQHTFASFASESGLVILFRYCIFHSLPEKTSLGYVWNRSWLVAAYTHLIAWQPPTVGRTVYKFWKVEYLLFFLITTGQSSLEWGSVCRQSLKVVIELNYPGGFPRKQTPSSFLFNPSLWNQHLKPDSTTYFVGLLSSLYNLSKLLLPQI